MRQRAGNPWTALVVVGLVVAGTACGNSSQSGGSDESGGSSGGDDDGQVATVDEPGVSDTEIRVGGVASTTNPLDGKFGEAFDGVEAYFAMVNEDGGVHGRELVLAAQHDDQVASNDTAIQSLLTQDDVFAVLPVASLLFTGADELVEAGMPTFGWTLNPEWEGTAEEPRENLFGQNGSFLCFGCASPVTPYVAQEAGANRIGLLAYNVPQSADCAEGIERSFEEYQEPGSPTVVFSDKSLTYGVADLSVQVSRMRDENVDLVMTCMDLQGVVTLAREMNRQSLDAAQYLPNAYDQDILTEFGDLFQGSYVLTFFTPFEVDEPPPGLESYLEWIDRIGGDANENSMNGWLSAALFVEGLRQAGPDFSQQAVIDAINEMTDWDADGLLGGVDWTRAHTEPADPSCVALSRIEDEAFVPLAGEPDEPFVCLARDADGIPEPTTSG